MRLIVAFILLCSGVVPHPPASWAQPLQDTASPVKVLVNATAGQDLRFPDVFQEVEKWVNQKAFPGAVLAVGQHGRLLILRSFGRMDYSAGAPAMSRDAIFDLASLSKVIATTTASELLYDRHLLDLDAPVIQYIPEFAGTQGHEKVLVRHLLSHSSGLNSQRVLWKQANDRAGIMELIYRLPLDWEPGTRTQYRDYNMILMGEIIQRITHQRLDKFLAHNVFRPLGMKDTRYNPPLKRIRRIPPTEQDDVLRHRLVRGVVHDENAFLMGGVSGHAGLFSSARDLSRFAQMYLNGGTYKSKRVVSGETLNLFMERQLSPPGTMRALGWDTPAKGSFPGDLASPRAIIHTGFTGTSIYIDPERDAFVILLTNRVHPTRQNVMINQARPAIHTAILAALDREQASFPKSFCCATSWKRSHYAQRTLGRRSHPHGWSYACPIVACAGRLPTDSSSAIGRPFRVAEIGSWPVDELREDEQGDEVNALPVQVRQFIIGSQLRVEDQFGRQFAGMFFQKRTNCRILSACSPLVTPALA